MLDETFFTYDDELNTVQMYSRQDLINRINDYVLNFEEDEEYIIKDNNNYDYNYFSYKLSNTYSREHLFLIIDKNNKVLYKSSNELK